MPNTDRSATGSQGCQGLGGDFTSGLGACLLRADLISRAQWLFGQRFDPTGIGATQDLLDSRYSGNEVNGTFVGKPIPGGALTLHLQFRLYEDDTLEGETLTMQPMTGERHGVLVPAGVPSGDYEILLNGTDQANANLFCMNVTFTM